MIEIEGPAAEKICIATAWVIKAAAICLVLYGVAELVSAVRWW